MPTSIGTIPDNLGLGDVYEVDLGAELPQAVIGRRALYDELIWDEDSGFSGPWAGRSSLGLAAGVYTMVLGRQAYSAAGLALFRLDSSGGGGGGAGDATSIQGIDVTLDAPTDGQVLTYEAGDDELQWTTPTGLGDVVGPASAVDDRVVTFDGATGKLVQDGANTIDGEVGRTATISFDWIGT